MASHSFTVLLKSAVVMPEWVAATISSMPFSPEAASPLRSPFRIEAKGSFVFHSGCWFDVAFTRSMAKAN